MNTNARPIINEIRRLSGVVRESFMAKEYLALDTEQKRIMQDVAFMWGHNTELVNKLQDQSRTPEEAAKAFPCFMLFTDFPVTLNEYGEFHGTTLQIVIAMWSNPEYDSPTRDIINFQQVLRPLQNYFLEELTRSNIFQVNSIADIKCNIWERFNWGRKGLYGNVGNVFNDFVDCIQFENLKLKLCEDFCS